MCGDDWPDACRSEQVTQVLRSGTLVCRLGDETGECTLHRSFAAHALGLAAQPHRGMLFDDRKQLEPNSVGLENTGEQFRREIPGLGFSAQDRGDLRMLAVHHIRQQCEQYVRGFLAVERGLNAARRIAGLNPLPAGSKLLHALPPRLPDTRISILSKTLTLNRKLSSCVRGTVLAASEPARCNALKSQNLGHGRPEFTRARRHREAVGFHDFRLFGGAVATC